ncbi:hypothetical protein EWH99_09200 [Sporolactobacillus sp. THM7-7]|nr:hypothetical protein EWH99_09200 [Sporolactobacillus sp. THM7-7]
MDSDAKTAMEITGAEVKDKKTFALPVLQKVGIMEDQTRQKVLTLSGGPAARGCRAGSLLPMT